MNNTRSDFEIIEGIHFGPDFADYTDLKTVPDVAIRVYQVKEGIVEIRQCRLSTRTLSERVYRIGSEVCDCYGSVLRMASVLKKFNSLPAGITTH